MIKFDCGCEFNTNEQGKIIFTIKDIEDIREDCPATWELFHSGKTRGIFQLEKNLGRKWSKEIKPSNIDELGAVISLIRPGCLKAISNGKSMTKWYSDRKSGLVETEYFHPELEAVLAPTYGVLTYQEQSIKIAQHICGFDLKQADILRKAIGKKKADLMAELKQMFIDGAAKVGLVTKEEAEQIFEWIKKSERYSFNKAHAIGYATDAYWTAYCKAHFPRHFFCAYLRFAANKPNPHEEIRELINDAHLFDIEIESPDFRHVSQDFHILEDSVAFGIGNIKSIGPAVIQKIVALQKELNFSIKDMSWVTFLVAVSSCINKTAVENLIDAGALDFIGLPRRKMKFEYSKYRELSNKELQWCETKFKEEYDKYKDITLQELLKDVARPKKEGGGCANKNRVEDVKTLLQSVESPPFSLNDSREYIIESEDKLLGIPVTLSKIDDITNYNINTSCKELIDGKTGNSLVLGAVIERVKKFTVKSGKNVGADMAFLTLSDKSGIYDSCVLFADQFYDFEHLLEEKAAVVVIGNSFPGKDTLVITSIISKDEPPRRKRLSNKGGKVSQGNTSFSS